MVKTSGPKVIFYLSLEHMDIHHLLLESFTFYMYDVKERILPKIGYIGRKDTP